VTAQQKAEVDRLTEAFEASGASSVEHRPVSWNYATPIEVTARWDASPVGKNGYWRSVLVLVDGESL
jgi:hypothetical protein